MKKNLFKGKYFVGGVDDKVHFEIEVKMFLPADEPPDKEKLAAVLDDELLHECGGFVETIIENENILEILDYLKGDSEDQDDYVDISMDTDAWGSEFEEVELVDK